MDFVALVQRERERGGGGGGGSRKSQSYIKVQTLYLIIHLNGQLDVLGREALQGIKLCSNQLEIDRMEEGVVSCKPIEVGVDPIWPQQLWQVRMELPAPVASSTQ